MAEQRHGGVTVSDGTNLHYIDAGSGRPLVMIPGWSQSAAEFKHQIDDLAIDRRVIALDMRGHGESDKPDHGYRIARLSRDLDDVLEQVNLYAYGDTDVGHLSAGQKRRLAMARLLATDSMLWILDEPFTSLDKASMAMFAEMFERHLQREGIIVMTSHHDISLPNQAVKRLNLGA